LYPLWQFQQVTSQTFSFLSSLYDFINFSTWITQLQHFFLHKPFPLSSLADFGADFGGDFGGDFGASQEKLGHALLVRY